MSSTQSHHQRQHKNQPWIYQETRHYCQYCNVWMGSDRQSIRMHENGQKHRDRVEQFLHEQRRKKLKQEQSTHFLQQSLSRMEAAAQESLATTDALYFMDTTTTATVPQIVESGVVHPPWATGSMMLPNAAMQQQHSLYQQFDAYNNESHYYPQHSVIEPNGTIPTTGGASAPSNHNPLLQRDSRATNREKKRLWEDRKKEREENRKRKSNENDNENEIENENHDQRVPPVAMTTASASMIPPKRGHYTTSDAITWLEGQVFGSGILEEDMPVQWWSGSSLASTEEKRLVERGLYWKDALVLAVRRIQPTSIMEENCASSPDINDVGGVVVDVAYVESVNAVEETIAKNVPLDRIRIQLGNPKDDRIPDSLEEAHLLAMGGVVVEEFNPAPTNGNPSNVATTMMDEATGLSSWTTVSVKTTSVRQELKEERLRLRNKQRESDREAARQAKATEERKMEEAKVANADDSALGAYDIWNRGESEGYKGVEIHREAKVEIHEVGKKLALENSVGFKKLTSKNNKPRKRNVRITSADD